MHVSELFNRLSIYLFITICEAIINIYIINTAIIIIKTNKMSWNYQIYKQHSNIPSQMSLSMCSDLKTQSNDYSPLHSENNSNTPGRKVSFGKIEYIKVQSYKTLNKQCRINDIILTTEEAACECNCILI